MAEIFHILVAQLAMELSIGSDVSPAISFPIENGIPRMLLPAIRAALQNDAASTFDAKQAKTALSFGYEWQRFPEMYAEWESSFSITCSRTTPTSLKEKGFGRRLRQRALRLLRRQIRARSLGHRSRSRG